jgi:hypothetical protein
VPVLRHVRSFDAADVPHVAALQRAGVGVCELFAEGLRALGVQSVRSEIRLFLHDGAGRSGVEVEVPDLPDGFEGVLVHVPEGVEDLPAPARARLFLDVLTTAAARLGELRGWDGAVAEDARGHALRRGLSFTWDGPWKRSPDRRHEARASYVVTGEGDGLVALQIRDHAGLIASSPHARTRPTVGTFRRTSRALRWSGPDAVELAHVGDGPAALRLATGDGVAVPDEPITLRDEPPGSARLPPVTLVFEDEAARRIVAVGGGPTNEVPEEYLAELHELFEQLEEPAWQDWWASSGLPRLEVYWSGAAERDGPHVRRGRHRVVARIERRARSVADPERPWVARDDLTALMALAQKRAGLPAPPRLR